MQSIILVQINELLKILLATFTYDNDLKEVEFNGNMIKINSQKHI